MVELLFLSPHYFLLKPFQFAACQSYVSVWCLCGTQSRWSHSSISWKFQRVFQEKRKISLFLQRELKATFSCILEWCEKDFIPLHPYLSRFDRFLHLILKHFNSHWCVLSRIFMERDVLIRRPVFAALNLSCMFHISACCNQSKQMWLLIISK